MELREAFMLKSGLLIGLFALISLGISPVTSSDQTKAAGPEPIWVLCITCPCRCHYFCDGQYGLGSEEYQICMNGCTYGCDHG